MASLPQKLLGAALRVVWEHGRSEDQQAVGLIAQRVPGFSDARYAEASRRAAALDRSAYEMAAAWFASRGQGPGPTTDELQARHPGFAWEDYAEAAANNLTWARR
jgi:hypothetical protein